MALCLFLRNASRPCTFQGLLKVQSIVTRKSADFSQLAKRNEFNFVKNGSKLGAVVTVPRRFAHTGDHSKHWVFDRVLSVFLLGAVPAAIISPCNITDNLLAVAMVLHVHMGFESMVIDYVRPIHFGHFIPKACVGLVYIISCATLGGLLYFNYSDVGIGKGIRSLWALKGKE